MKNLVLAAVLATCGVANATDCVLADANRDTGWTARFDSAQVTECRFVGNPGTGRNKGTLHLTLRIADKNGVAVDFVQRNRATADNFGFRVTANFTIDNRFQVLKGIRGRSFDRNDKLEEDQNQFVSDDHPGFAHHHQDATFNPGPFVGAQDCDCESERDFKIEGQGLLNVFVSGVVSGIGLHQIEEQGLRRSYTLLIKPRPFK